MIRKLSLKASVAAVVAAHALCCAQAQAATLVDTGAGNGGRVGDVRYGSTMIEKIYGQITLANASRIDTIQGYIDSYAGSLGVSLRSDLNGKPGDVLNVQGKSYSTAFNLIDSESWQGAANLGWQVAAGTYWISFENTNMSPFTAPYMQLYAADRPLAKYAEYSRGKIWPSNQGFGFRVFGDVSAVPEPATWALMIVGFGAIGVAMRRRRVRVRFVTA